MLGGIGFGLFLDEVAACAIRLTSDHANCNSGRSVKAGVRSLDPAPRWHVARSSRIKHENAVLARLRDENSVRGIECNSARIDEVRTQDGAHWRYVC